MNGKWTRSAGGNDPVAVLGIGLLGIVVSVAVGCIAALAKAHLLSIHTPWRRVPFALWMMRHYPIVWKPFSIGFAVGLGCTGAAILLAIFEQQKLHGEARWASPREIRHGKLFDAGGIVLGRRSGKFLRFGGSEHVLLEAPTRAGKGVGVVIPNLLIWPDSVVVLDVKQENWDLTAGFREKVLKQKVLLFNPLDAHGRTARFNPLGHIDRNNEIAVVNELQKIAAMLFPPPPRGESFWNDSARTAFIGVAAYVAATIADGADALPFTMGEIYRNFAAGDAKRRFPRVIRQRSAAGKALSGPCISALKDWYTSSDNTFTGIRQSVTAKINLWMNPLVDAATSSSDFELADFRNKRISLYLGVTPDDLERIAPIYNLLFQQLIDLNVRALPTATRNNVQLLLLLDEFARLGRASVIASGFSYVAGYGIRLLPVIQSRAQLRGVYGKEVTDEIIANCGVELVFRPKEWDAAREISDRLGTYTFRARSRSMASWGGKGGSTSDSDQRRALLMPQELGLMPEGDLIVMRPGIRPVQGRKIRYYADKTMLAKTRIGRPDIDRVRVDPAIAARSLQIIELAEHDNAPDVAEKPHARPLAGEDQLTKTMAVSGSASWGDALNQAAVAPLPGESQDVTSETGDQLPTG